MGFKKAKVFIASLILLVGLVWLAILKFPDQRLHLIFCDVGQGDATLIVYQQTQVLIDGGPNSRVLGCLSEHLPFWDRTIEMVILTHPEADHYTGLVDVLKRYNVNLFVSNPLPEDKVGLQELRQLVSQKTKTHAPVVGERLRIGALGLQVLWPPADFAPGGQANAGSIVLQLTFSRFKAFLPGDLPTTVESQLDLSGSINVQVLKVGHHGSKTSTSQALLEKLKPQLAVISVGRNSYGHPTQEVLDRLKAAAAKVLRTDQDGEVEVTTDGQAWSL